MTTRHSGHHHQPQFLYLQAFVPDHRISSNEEDDFDNFEMIKFDIWNTNNDYHYPINRQNPTWTATKISDSMVTSLKPPLKPHHSHQKTSPVIRKSLPVDIPDWSKILWDAYKQSGCNLVDEDDSGGGGGDDEWLPPHEYLARIRSDYLSVHEGVGRRLKGRDLSRLRNAIWKQTGFEQD